MALYVVQYVRAIKYYAWEQFFQNRIDGAREAELKEILSLNQSRAILLQVSSAIGGLRLG